MNYLHPVEAIGVNGLHAVVISMAILRADMLRKGRTYELLITRHSRDPVTDGQRPQLGTGIHFRRISEFQSIDFHSFTAAYFETLLVLAIAAAFWHFGKGRWGASATAPELVTPGIVLGTKHSDLRGCGRALDRPDGA